MIVTVKVWVGAGGVGRCEYFFAALSCFARKSRRHGLLALALARLRKSPGLSFVQPAPYMFDRFRPGREHLSTNPRTPSGYLPFSEVMAVPFMCYRETLRLGAGCQPSQTWRSCCRGEMKFYDRYGECIGMASLDQRRS